MARPGALLAFAVALTVLPWRLFPGEQLLYQHRISDAPHSIHILEVDPQRAEIIAVRARDAAIGRERVSTLARRFDAAGAVNGGFFRIGGDFDGEPSGALRIDGRWYSEARRPRGAIGWTDGGRRVIIDRLRVDFSLRSDSWTLPLDGMNRPRGRRERVIYTPEFGSAVPGGSSSHLIGRADGTVELAGDPHTTIPEGGWVAALPENEIKLPEGRVRLVADLTSAGAAADEWERMETIVGGTPVLIRNGTPVEDFSSEQVAAGFVQNRHPRTAVCIKKDGNWLLVAVDGRQPRLSIGMTMAELTALLQELGCRDALNLDGGGSTTFYWDDQVRNSPSDPTGERPVSDAILILEPAR